MVIKRENRTIYGQDHNKRILKLAFEQNVPVLLMGETGTGKTSIVKEVAEAMGQEVIRVNLNGQTSVDEFVGKWLIRDGATVWVDGVLIMAMKRGMTLLVDEINAALPEILFVLHSLLDDDRKVLLSEKEGEIVHPHANFRFVATCNPSDEYVGTKELNKAFMSRFHVVLEFAYPDQQTEAKILRDRTGISEFDSQGLSYYAVTIRNQKSNENIYFTLSTRELIYWASFMEELGNEESFKVTVLNKASREDRPILEKCFTEVFQGRIKPAANTPPVTTAKVKKATM